MRYMACTIGYSITMRISTIATELVTTLHVHCPRLDAVVADELRAALGEAITGAGAASDEIVVDLAEVQFIDSSGLAALIGALRPVTPGVALANVCTAVRTVLRLTRVDRAIPVRG